MRVVRDPPRTPLLNGGKHRRELPKGSERERVPQVVGRKRRHFRKGLYKDRLARARSKYRRTAAEGRDRGVPEPLRAGPGEALRNTQGKLHEGG